MSRVICFVKRGRRPNRREQINEPTTVLKFMKHWGKLLMKNGVLYSVSKNSVTKKKTYLYVVPDAIKTMVLKGVHDQTGHQGQQRILLVWPGEGCESVCKVLLSMCDQQDTRTRRLCAVGKHQINRAP